MRRTKNSMCQVGTIVTINARFHGIPKGSLGYCYEVVQPEGHNYPVMKIITEQGINLEGFCKLEQDKYLELIALPVETETPYNFTNLPGLATDFHYGRFEFAFSKAKESLEHLETILAGI